MRRGASDPSLDTITITSGGTRESSCARVDQSCSP